MEVIGAGWGRTGTASLKIALQQLGFDPCYHMLEVFENKSDVHVWLDAADKVEAGEKVDWNSFFAARGYRAAVDHPCCAYFKELWQANPDAKIILAIRDSPEDWYDSARATIAPGPPSFVKLLPFWRHFTRMTQKTIWNNPRTFGSNFDFSDRERALAAYRDWIVEVKRTVPAEKLLVFNVKQGWEPLCKFLERPVPNTPFPRVNDREHFREWAKKTTMQMMLSALGRALVIGVSTYACVELLRSHFNKNNKCMPCATT